MHRYEKFYKCNNDNGRRCNLFCIYTTKAKYKKLNQRGVVRVNDIMPETLWTWYFLVAQGYQIKDKVIYQDNQNSILLEKNGSI